MVILTEKDKRTPKSIKNIIYEYINRRKHKSILNICLYSTILIFCFGLFINKILGTGIFNMMVLMCILVALFLIFDSIKEFFNLRNAEKSSYGYKIINGILKAQKNDNTKGSKINYFINDTKIYIADKFYMKDLNQFLNKKVNGYFIGDYLILLEII